MDLIGKRIKLTSMPDDPNPIPVDTEGTVLEVVNYGGGTQIRVAWDNGSSLYLSVPPDKFEVLP